MPAKTPSGVVLCLDSYPALGVRSNPVHLPGTPEKGGQMGAVRDSFPDRNRATDSLRPPSPDRMRPLPPSRFKPSAHRVE